MLHRLTRHDERLPGPIWSPTSRFSLPPSYCQPHLAGNAEPGPCVVYINDAHLRRAPLGLDVTCCPGGSADLDDGVSVSSKLRGMQMRGFLRTNPGSGATPRAPQAAASMPTQSEPFLFPGSEDDIFRDPFGDFVPSGR